ncbi:serine hydrolase [Blastococcus sp. CCUG 61487]|uniref:D-alanyl-D-alanine carboxypeptidase family protein n=1 Tax=Blastococcus sp. CCUG 61487 TaxID=1840703 RepID=UPI0010BFCC4B|nr:serine hydrolase [Blastococcus sp. CCUG 61487]
MGRRGGRRALLGVVLVTGVVLVSAGPAWAEAPRPTADPAAPAPSAPRTERPPQGSAPDGSTVGGERLDTRGVVVTKGAPPLPEIAASGWLVADAGRGAVLAARDPHGRYYPASTLKALTLLTLAPLLDPMQVVVGTPEDENTEGSRVGLIAGGQYPVGFLYLGLMLQSGNDAANALARAAGGTEALLAAMTETAESIGAYDTVPGSPSGLDVAGQSSSPYDLALIFRELVENPYTAAVLTTPVAQVPEVPGRAPGFQIQNENPLADYPGMLGGKTGFTDAARHTFVTAAERDGRRLVVSVLDTEPLPLRAADQAALLLDWGFALPPGSDGVGRLVRPADLAADPPRTSPPARAVTQSGPVTAAPEDGGVPAWPAGIGLAGVAAVVVGLAVTGRRRNAALSRGPSPSDRPDR